MHLTAALFTLAAVVSALPCSAAARIPAVAVPINNIPTTLRQNGLTSLVDLVVRAGMANALSGPGPFTIFAPTNQAIAAVDPATVKALQMDINLLKRVLAYHVVASDVSQASGRSDLTPKTLSGDKLRINFYGKDVTINGALRQKTLRTTNGVIYVIDKVLMPDDKERDIAQVLEKKRQFTTLLTALRTAGLTDTIKSAGPFTLFAPTDAAFKALPHGALNSLMSKPEELKKVLLHHVITGTVYSRGLPSTGGVSLLDGSTVPVTITPRGVTVGKARVIEADVYASNGVIHVIDAVVLPEIPKAAPVVNHIPQVLTDNGLTTLVDLVKKAGLASALSGPGPFTVFAPTNDAFTAVDPATLKSLQMDANLLKRVLSYHVVGSALPQATLKSELSTKTLAGDSLRINIYGKDITANGALRIKTLETTNGIIYVIDKVLIPDTAGRDIAQVLEKKAEFSTLLTALKVAGLTSTIQSAGPFTLFAPNDAAFKALPAGVLDSLIANPEELKKLLLNHVLSSTVYSRGLPSAGDVASVGGSNIVVSTSHRPVKIGSAQVVEADLSASNGVIHVINSVLQSPSAPITGKIAKVLTDNGFTTLVDLISKAGLAEDLSGTGPFTVFAPTNEAFGNVDMATLKALQMDVKLLKKVLSNHVVASELKASNIKNELTAKTLAEQNVRLNVYGSKVTANGALSSKTLEAGNGIIYAIDKVLIPDDERNIIQVLEKKGTFNTLLFALGATELSRNLESNGPFTLFAPTDEAFKALPNGELDKLIANPAELKKILLSHVLSGTIYSHGLSNGKINLARGGSVPVVINKEGVKISDANVIEADLTASNGVIHIIDKII